MSLSCKLHSFSMLALGAVLGLALPGVLAADDSALSEVRSGCEAFVTAFNSGDAKAVADLWTEQGEYVDEAGQVYSGREAIEKAYASFFAEHKDAKINVKSTSLRLVGETVAIEEGRAEVEPAPAGAPARVMAAPTGDDVIVT